jgi:DNA-binding IclR family transcriptional regulator
MSAVTVPVGNRSGAMGAPVSVGVFSGRVGAATLEEEIPPVLNTVAARLQRAL